LRRRAVRTDAGLQSSRPELNADLKDGGRTGTSRTGMRNVMVVAQVALALVLLIGAGLMLTSFRGCAPSIPDSASPKSSPLN
jgi:hypothetical protein